MLPGEHDYVEPPVDGGHPLTRLGQEHVQPGLAHCKAQLVQVAGVGDDDQLCEGEPGDLLVVAGPVHHAPGVHHLPHTGQVGDLTHHH